MSYRTMSMFIVATLVGCGGDCVDRMVTAIETTATPAGVSQSQLRDGLKVTVNPGGQVKSIGEKNVYSSIVEGAAPPAEVCLKADVTLQGADYWQVKFSNFGFYDPSKQVEVKITPTTPALCLTSEQIKQVYQLDRQCSGGTAVINFP